MSQDSAVSSCTAHPQQPVLVGVNEHARGRPHRDMHGSLAPSLPKAVQDEEGEDACLSVSDSRTSPAQQRI